MHSTFGKRTLGWAGFLALLAVLLAPSPAEAVPEPGAKGRGFRLFARSLGAITVNRVYCGLNSAGEVCVDSTGSSTIGGGYWPKGTADQYIFNSGLQLAGIISGGPWDTDTTGAFFFDPKGTTVHGAEVTPIYNSQNPEDVAAWPAAALVPSTGAGSQYFDEILKGRVSASQGDIWYLTWEGDPGANAGRPHPLGIMAEVRGFGWNYPRGNEDILYFLYTFYNITSTVAADYAGQRPEMQDLLKAQADIFHARNNATFGITLPAGGYTITDLFAAFARDDDVANSGGNYSSVNLPFALGYTYDKTFDGPSQTATLGFTFPDALFGAPFFKGSGFTGAKYLASPTGAGEIQLFSNTIRQGFFGDPGNTTQLYRYLSGGIDGDAGDDPCSYDPVTDRICFVNNSAAADMRFFQSSTPLSLAPGESGSIVVAYIHAAPVALPNFTGDPNADIKPGDPRGLGDPVAMAASINQIDSLTGFLGFQDGSLTEPADGVVEQKEFIVVEGSLLGKSLVAQTIFDNKFLLPFAPESPEFFLVPGDNEVTLFWRASPTVVNGDPFFAISSNRFNPDLTVNPLYDANYRQNDVEGYRVYRGRVDNPEELELLAQYDDALSTFKDFYGTMNVSGRCAPEILEAGVPVEDDCAADFDDVLDPTVTLAQFAEFPLVGNIYQVTSRVLLADGSVLQTTADTVLTSEANGNFPLLSDTGVPFQFVDRNVRNGFRYFYAVTAFDVNSIRSGPSSLESARITKATVPVKSATNYAASGSITGLRMLGGGVELNPNAPSPTIDATNGTFSGPAAPANAWDLGFVELIATVLNGDGSFSVVLDSIQPGSPYASPAVPHKYFYSAPASGAIASVAIVQQPELGVRTGNGSLAAAGLDQSFAERYGGSSEFAMPARIDMRMDGADYTSLYGRGCVNGRPGFDEDAGVACNFNGSRWFNGPSPANNETFAHPNGGNNNVNVFNPMTTPNNAGALTGVENIHNTMAYYQANGVNYRPIEGIKSASKRAADFNVTWGAGGTIESVFDVTHNVAVPFQATHAAGTWGILNASATDLGSPDGRAELTNLDMLCVEPYYSYGGANPCASPAPFQLSQTADPDPVVMPTIYDDGVAATPAESAYLTAAAQPNAGIVLYLSGDWFTFELTGGAVPAAGTVWSLRQYIGAIKGGQNSDGSVNHGAYVFTPSAERTMSAVGVELAATYSVSNATSAVVNQDLSGVHTVPDPYYVTNEYEVSTETKIIRFVNLPAEAIIRIYSASGVLVTVLEHQSSQFGGEEVWNVRNRNNQVVASGVYFYHIEAGDARKVGRFTVVNFAQ